MENESEAVGLVMPRKLYAAVVIEAGKRGVTVSSMIRQLLQEGLNMPVESGGRRSRIAEAFALMEEADVDGPVEELATENEPS